MLSIKQHVPEDARIGQGALQAEPGLQHVHINRLICQIEDYIIVTQSYIGYQSAKEARTARRKNVQAEVAAPSASTARQKRPSLHVTDQQHTSISPHTKSKLRSGHNQSASGEYVSVRVLGVIVGESEVPAVPPLISAAWVLLAAGSARRHAKVLLL